MRNYIVSDEGGELVIKARSFRAAAEAFADGFEVGDRTLFVNCSVALAHPKKSESDRQQWHKVVIHPTEPRCAGRTSHDWSDGPVYGQGGGVSWSDTCSECGATRRYTNWGTDPSDGTDGHIIWSYGRSVIAED